MQKIKPAEVSALLKKQLETNFANIDSLETEIRSMMLTPLEKNQEKDVRDTQLPGPYRIH